MAFDVQGARKAGYSDPEIVDFLAQERKFDVAGARQAGHSDADILRHLTSPPQRGFGERAARLAGQLGAGFNERLGQVVGALPDLYNRGLRAAGLPAMPEGAYTRGIQQGLEATIGAAPAPEGTAELAARGAGKGLVDVGTMLIPAGRVVAATAPAIGAAPSLTNRMATVMASQPALQTVAGTTAGAVGEATDSPLAALATALAVPTVAATGARLITPIQQQGNAEYRALVAAAEREGIPVTAGQATGSRFLKNLEGRLEQLPFTGARQRAIREGQQENFTTAVMRRTGTAASEATPDTLKAIKAKVGGQIGEIANRNTLNVTPDFENQLTQIEDNLRFYVKDVADPVRARIAQLRGMMVTPPSTGGAPLGPGQIAPNPVIPGASYRMMDSAIGDTIRETGRGDVRAALGQLRQILRSAMDNSISPEDAAAWRQANRDYANAKVIEDAMNSAGEIAATGQIPPLSLRGAVNRSTGSGYSSGRGDLNELARIGQSVLRPPPDTGTAGNNMANALLTGQLAAAGGIGGTMAGGPIGGLAGAASSMFLPRIVQALMNSEAGQAYLRNQAIQNGPRVTPALISALTGQQGAAYAVQP
jgi:hypothetical protein